MCGVDTFDIEGRIGFGIAKLLCFFQHFREVALALSHFGENKVAGAVDDTGQPLNGIRGETFTQRLDDGNATGDSAFVGNNHALLAGCFKNGVAVHGDQCLVGCHYMLAILDGVKHQFQRRIETTDQLHNDVDVGVFGNVEHILADFDVVFF